MTLIEALPIAFSISILIVGSLHLIALFLEDPAELSAKKRKNIRQ